jgi:hypothetical protein
MSASKSITKFLMFTASYWYVKVKLDLKTYPGAVKNKQLKTVTHLSPTALSVINQNFTYNCFYAISANTHAVTGKSWLLAMIYENSFDIVKPKKSFGGALDIMISTLRTTNNGQPQDNHRIPL